MRISVVIPVHNRSRLLARALSSVARQSYPPWEVLVVDDGSSDDPQAVQHVWRKAYPDLPLRWFCNRPAHGVSHARNLGIREARGEWIALLDSDDMWLPHKLQLQVTHWQKKPAAANRAWRRNLVAQRRKG